MTSTTLTPTAPERSRARRQWRTPDGAQIGAEAAVRAYLAGDTRALETLMSQFGGMMTCIARRYLHCNQDVEDAVQDAWIAFARSAHGIETPAAVPGWLRVTTSRAALSIARRQARCTLTELPPGGGPLVSEPDPVELDDDQHAVRDAVARLDGRDRELIALLFESELSYAEIVAHTGRPVGWIGPTRQRVMSKLRKDRSIRQLAEVRASTLRV